MPSEVDICNLALSHLGDTATVTSISPPEGSAQSEHCARFYPIARDALLELHPWSFATRRAALTLLTDTIDQWLYLYQMPNLVINVLAVIPPDVTDDYYLPNAYGDTYGYSPEVLPAAGSYVPQPYQIETLASGVQVICTNQEDAVLRYTVKVTDPTQFSPLFVKVLGHLLASDLAGPLIKGEMGAAEAKRQEALAYKWLAEATQSDAVQRQTKPTQVVSWMAGR